MSRFLDALHSGRVLLMDGAMGTELQRAGLREDECGELWNLTHADRVRAIHQRYADVGAVCFLTNTFQSNPRNLEKHGAREKMVALNAAAVDLARSAAGENGFVLGAIGPINVTLDRDNIRMLESVVNAFAGVDALLLETWSHSLEALSGLYAIRHEIKSRDVPLLLSIAYRTTSTNGDSGISPNPEIVGRLAEACGIDALGVNCGREIGVAEMIEILRRYRTETALPLFARPNAGTPTRIDNGWIYPMTAPQMATKLPNILETGVSMVGGCCGTTPEHIAALRPIVEKWNQSH